MVILKRKKRKNKMELTHKKIEEIVNDKEWRSYEEGFTNLEMQIILNKYDNIVEKRVNNSLLGNTCMVIDNNMINYPWDVRTALICGIEDREETIWEMD
tara:strand:- start:63 stop:359 length:297 start_codon:yes stop_codon:yes gene_type:complete